MHSMMDKKLSKEDYLEILRRKREAGSSTEYSDFVYYKGKVMKKCPSGTSKSGKTCAPTISGMGLTKPKQQDLGGINPAQAKRLGQAKSRTDVRKSRKY